MIIDSMKNNLIKPQKKEKSLNFQKHKKKKNIKLKNL